MAIVPQARNTQSMRGLPSGGLQAADSGNAQMIARAGRQMGSALSRYADEEDRRLALLDEAAAKQIDLEWSAFERQQLFGDGEKPGYAASLGLDALNGRQPTEQAFEAKRKELIAKAKNPRQQMLVEQTLGARYESAVGRIGQHASRQAAVYEEQSAKLREADLIDRAIIAYGNDEEYGKITAALFAETMERSAKWGVEAQGAELRRVQTAIHNGVIDQMSNTSAVDAMRYLDLHRDQMDVRTAEKWRDVLEPEATRERGEFIADAVLGLGLGAEPGRVDFDRLWGIQVGAESNNRQFGKNGKPLESVIIRDGKRVEGAIGAAQVMRGTGPEAAKLAGLPWDENRWKTDKDYNLAIGKAYSQEMFRQFGNNPHVALAAYNAGPGKVREWIASIGDPRKGEISGAEWVARLPYKDTRDYVVKIMRDYGATGPKYAPRDEDMGAALARLDQMDLTPDERKAAEASITARAARNSQLLKEAEAKATERALTYVDQGKRPPPALLAALPRESRARVERELDALAKGEEVKSDPVEVAQLRVLAVTDPEKLAALDLATLRGKMAPDDIKQVAGWQAAALKQGGTSVSQKDMVDAAKPVLNSMDIITGDSQKAQRPKNAEKLDAFMRRMEGLVENHTRTTGKAPTSKELREFADYLGREVVVETGFFSDTKKRNYELNVATVPAADRQEIVEALRQQGIMRPTDAQITAVYLGAQ
jgi:soluble lytic murein transglycosylase